MKTTHETSEHQRLMEGLLGDAAGRALAYLRDSPGWPVAPAAGTVEALHEIDRPLQDAPTSPAQVLALLDRVGSPATVVTTGGRYFGFVNGGALPASVAASWLASAWDQNVALRVMSPAAAAFEDVALEWVRDLLGLPAAAAARWSTAPRSPVSRRWRPPGMRNWPAPAGMSSAMDCSVPRR